MTKREENKAIVLYIHGKLLSRHFNVGNDFLKEVESSTVFLCEINQC
jgi:hypothetical protein